MQKNKNPKHAVKKALLKKIIKGKGLGKNPTSDTGSGGGENLGTNGIF